MTSDQRTPPRARVSLRLSYMAVLHVCGRLALLTRSNRVKDAEILILRRPVAVLQRQDKTPGLCCALRRSAFPGHVSGCS
jgi:hypothetical protein